MLENPWQSLPKGTPLPFSDIPLVGITEVQGKPVTVVDWMLVRDYYDKKGKWHFMGGAFIVLDYESKQVKIKVVNNPFMNGRLKQERGAFRTAIRRTGTGFVFVK